MKLNLIEQFSWSRSRSRCNRLGFTRIAYPLFTLRFWPVGFSLERISSLVTDWLAK